MAKDPYGNEPRHTSRYLNSLGTMATSKVQAETHKGRLQRAHWLITQAIEEMKPIVQKSDPKDSIVFHYARLVDVWEGIARLRGEEPCPPASKY